MDAYRAVVMPATARYPPVAADLTRRIPSCASSQRRLAWLLKSSPSSVLAQFSIRSVSLECGPRRVLP